MVPFLYYIFQSCDGVAFCHCLVIIDYDVLNTFLKKVSLNSELKPLACYLINKLHSGFGLCAFVKQFYCLGRYR